jgi:predicted small metal-binding protein
MAKMLSCKDVGVDCNFVARGKTVDEILKKASEHARKEHGVKRVTKDYLESWRKHVHDEK